MFTQQGKGHLKQHFALTAVLGQVKVSLFCLHLEAPSEIKCVCFVPSVSFFLTSAPSISPLS